MSERDVVRLQDYGPEVRAELERKLRAAIRERAEALDDLRRVLADDRLLGRRMSHRVSALAGAAEAVVDAELAETDPTRWVARVRGVPEAEGSDPARAWAVLEAAIAGAQVAAAERRERERQQALLEEHLQEAGERQLLLREDVRRWQVVSAVLLCLVLVATALLGLERLVHDGPDAEGTPSAEVAP